MKNKLCLSIALILFSVTIMSAQPKLVIEGGTNYKWGTRDRMKENPVNTSFRFFNAGTDTLNVENPKPTCGCTTAPLDKNKVAPGDYATLSIKLHLNVDHGPYHKTIIVNSNDPQTPNITLNLDAEVNQNQGYGRVYTRPQQFLTFGMVKEGKKVNSDTMNLYNETNKDVTLSNIQIEPNDIKLNIQNNTKIPAGGSIPVIATYKPKALGQLDGKITMTTNDSAVTTMTIPIWGYVVKK